MFNILEEVNEFSNPWNYSFLFVALIAIFIGTALTVVKTKKEEKGNKKKDEHKYNYYK